MRCSQQGWTLLLSLVTPRDGPKSALVTRGLLVVLWMLGFRHDCTMRVQPIGKEKRTHLGMVPLGNGLHVGNSNRDSEFPARKLPI